MPQVDLETLLRGGGGDAKVACETSFHNDDVPPPPPPPPPAAAEYYPAESFCLSKEDELDWFDRNVFYQRNESTKANSNNHANVSNTTTHSNPHSQRFSSKASIIGLPKPHNSCFHDCKTRRNVKPGRILPKRLGSGGKSSSRLTEPASPKVSCIGRVRSNRSRHKKTTDRSKTEKLTTIEPEKTGFWSSFMEAFWCSCRNSYSVDVEEPSEKSTRKKNKKDEKCQQKPVDQANPPGLGGLNRFVSGRRSDSWAGDVDDLDSHHPAKVV